MLSNGNGRGTASLLANCAGSHFYYFLVCVMAWVAIFEVLHSWYAFCIVCDPSQPTHLVAERFCFSGMPLQPASRAVYYWGCSETCVSQMCLNLGHFESRGMHSS